MKKPMSVLLALTLLLSLAACGSGGAAKEAEATAAGPDPTAPTQAGEAAPSAAPAEAAAEDGRTGEAVDVDLTLLSSTMVYSEVYAMVYESEQYTGKTVKMQGLFATQEFNGARLYACVVQDATACCSQGLEFETEEALVYPADYPEPGTEITVVGTFDSYKEQVGGNIYLHLVLRNARFV